MTAVLQMSLCLTAPPVAVAADKCALRFWESQEDTTAWLELRRRAFARSQLGVRDWDEQDFAREITSKDWWRPDAMWLAERGSEDERRIVGSVMLGRRGDAQTGRPIVHWLMVDPAYRRRGVGLALMAALAQACWASGERSLYLETHVSWAAAVKLYERLGFVSVF